MAMMGASFSEQPSFFEGILNIIVIQVKLQNAKLDEDNREVLELSSDMFLLS